MYLGEPLEVVWFEEKYNALSILFSVFLWDLSPKKKKKKFGYVIYTQFLFLISTKSDLNTKID